MLVAIKLSFDFLIKDICYSTAEHLLIKKMLAANLLPLPDIPGW
jgi:hypothetical protein